MAKVVVIMGSSGSGKTSSLRNLTPKESLVLQVVRKELPFKSLDWEDWSGRNPKGSKAVVSTYGLLKQCIKSAVGDKSGKEVVVVDDAQYLLAGEFMARANETGFQKFTDIAKNVWDLVIELQELPGDARIYLIWHTEQLDSGHIKMKTIGKLLDDKITLDGLFTIILKSYCDAEGYWFATGSNGMDTVKTPMGMFDERVIDNDLKMVDEKICEYYGLDVEKS